MSTHGAGGEFAAIARYFRPLAAAAGRNLLDDAAVFAPPAGRELVMSADTLVAGVHFFADDPADAIAQKLLRVNLSDLAAMGAAPLHYLLSLSLPQSQTHNAESWLAAFAAGLAADQESFGITLIGGDTTSTPGPLSLALTIIGHVAPGQAVSRHGACAGDAIMVSGTIGDAALGLAARLGKLADPTGDLVARYLRPQPRLHLARADLVHAAIDVSDGLVQDIGHMATEAGLTAEVLAASLPASPAALAAGADWLMTRATGGDDYELALAVAPEHIAALTAHAASLGITISPIGRFLSGPAQVILRDQLGADITPAHTGWRHF